MSDLLDTGPLKSDARAGYPSSHPYRLAVETLPDSVHADELQAQLRVLLPLSRVKDG